MSVCVFVRMCVSGYSRVIFHMAMKHVHQFVVGARKGSDSHVMKCGRAAQGTTSNTGSVRSVSRESLAASDIGKRK